MAKVDYIRDELWDKCSPVVDTELRVATPQWSDRNKCFFAPVWHWHVFALARCLHLLYGEEPLIRGEDGPLLCAVCVPGSWEMLLRMLFIHAVSLLLYMIYECSFNSAASTKKIVESFAY